MPRPLATLALLFLALVLAAAQSDVRRLIRPVDGATIFRNSCAPCHGLDGRGKGPVAGALRQEVPDLTTLSRRHHGRFPAAQVRSTIMLGEDDLIPAHGSREMPIWGPIFHEIEYDQDLGNVRLQNVTSYLESMQRK